jgi:prophage antirepressor-like protein
MTASQLAIYSSEACEKGYDVDILLKDGAPWFRACQVTKILGYGNGRQAVIAHVKPKYTLTREALGQLEPTQGGCLENRRPLQDASVYISEPGLYALILRSKKKEAENFQDWVVEKVLPEIREKGSYQSRKPQTKLQVCLLNEFDLHIKIIDFVRKYHQEAIIVAGLGENQVTEKMRIDSYLKGYTAGQCDILLLNRHKKWSGLAIELKSPTGWGVVSPKQKNFLERLEGAGYKTLISCDYDEVILQIVEYFRDVRSFCSHCGRWFAKKHSH